MTDKHPDQERKFKRWYLSDSSIPAENQSDGVPVRLLRSLLFDWVICNAVIKDVGLGGAGALVPSDKEVPEWIRVQVSNTLRMRARVVHRHKVSEKLLFLGLDWSQETERKRSEMLNIVAKYDHANVQGLQRHLIQQREAINAQK